MRIVVRGRLDAPFSESMAVAVWREWRSLLQCAGLTRFRPYATTVNLFVILAFGVGIPWRRGFEFFDPLILLLYTFIALLFSAPAITDVLGSEWASARSVLARVYASAVFGFLVYALIVALGLITVNVQLHARHTLVPALDVLAAAFAMSFAAALAVASVGALLTVVLSPVSAKLMLRAGFVMLLLIVLFGGRFLPTSWAPLIAANLTPRTLTRSAFLVAGLLALFAAGPIFALRYARK